MISGLQTMFLALILGRVPKILWRSFRISDQRPFNRISDLATEGENLFLIFLMPKAKSSFIWDNFFEVYSLEPSYSLCLLCPRDSEQRKVKFVFSGCTHLKFCKAHLKDKHDISEEFIQNMEKTTTQGRNYFRNLLTNEISSDERMRLHAISFCKNSLPRSLIEDGSFQKANNIPSNTKIENLEKAIQSVAKECLKNLELCVKGGCCTIQIDCWENGNRYITGITCNGLLYKVFDVTDKETKENVIKVLTQHLKELELTFNTKILSISNDNCVKIDIPLALISTELAIIHTRCVAHGFSLSIKDIFKLFPDFKNLYNKANVISKIFRRRREAQELFKAKQQPKQPEPTDQQLTSSSTQSNSKQKVLMLMLPNKTRWLGQLTCWQRLCKLMPEVRETLNELMLDPSSIDKYLLNEYPDDNDLYDTTNQEQQDEDHYINEIKSSTDAILEINVIEQTKYLNYNTSCIEPLIGFMKEVQLSSFTLIEAVYFWQEIRQYIIAVFKWDSEYCPWINELNTNLRIHPTAKEDIQSFWLMFGKILDERSAQFNDKLITVAEYLIPEPIGTKYSYMDDSSIVINWFFGRGEAPELDQQADSHWNVGPRILKRILELRNNVMLDTDEIEDKKLKQFIEILHKEMSVFELERSWKIHTPNEKLMDPLEFWEFHKDQRFFPNLSLLAYYLLRVDVTNADVERLFKFCKNFLPPERNRLSTEKLNEEAIIKCNVDGGNKIEKVEERVKNSLEKHQKKMRYNNKDEEQMIKKLEELDAQIRKKRKRDEDQVDEDEDISKEVPSNKKLKIFKEISKGFISIGSRRSNSKTAFENRGKQ